MCYQSSDWHHVLTRFPELEIICGGSFIWFDPRQEMQISEVERANTEIQALAKVCPKLRVILVGVHARKAVIIRNGIAGAGAGVRWVVRGWEDNEDTVIRTGEKVYGQCY